MSVNQECGRSLVYKERADHDRQKNYEQSTDGHQIPPQIFSDEHAFFFTILHKSSCFLYSKQILSGQPAFYRLEISPYTASGGSDFSAPPVSQLSVHVLSASCHRLMALLPHSRLMRNCSVPSQLPAKIYSKSTAFRATFSYGQRSKRADLLNIYINVRCLSSWKIRRILRIPSLRRTHRT